MTADALSSRPFVRGWLVVGVALFGISTGPAAFGLASMGLVSSPLAAEFGWSMSQISGAVSLMMLATAACMPIAGKMVDKWGPRRVLLPSILVLAATFLLAPFIRNYAQFLAFYIAIGTVAVGTNSVAYMRILSSWFDRRRGLAIGVAGSGTGLGFAYVPLLSAALVAQFGWRGCYIGLGCILLFVTLPLVFFIMKETPQDVGLAVDGGIPSETAQPALGGSSLSEALRSRDFWVLLAVFVGLAFALYGLMPHLVPLLASRGMGEAAAASIASLFGLAAFGGRLLIGFLLDKFDARRIALIFFSLSAIGLFALTLSLPYWAFVVAAILLGGSLGAEVDMLAYLISRYFGLKAFSQIFSVMFSAVLMAMGTAPLIFGIVFDRTGSYSSILALCAPICLVAIGLVLLLRPYGAKARGAALSST
ncbi:MFS transporter [Brevundimonas sp.]|uniref:MFS transporter n=1 Tax=Brevundimonas sp. TaxID=1871086 RepID=UPI003BAC68F7